MLAELLSTLPGLRDPRKCVIAAILLSELAAEPFAMNTSHSQLLSICRRGRYRSMPPGQQICAPNDDANFFFIVLSGSVLIVEPAVHHQEGLLPAGTSRRMRQRTLCAGASFHHLPLVSKSKCYGYEASIPASSSGASLLLLPVTDYVQIFGAIVEREYTFLASHPHLSTGHLRLCHRTARLLCLTAPLTSPATRLSLLQPLASHFSRA